MKPTNDMFDEMKGETMALSNLNGWANENNVTAACGAACGVSDKPAEEAPAACGAADKPAEEAPAACGAADKPAEEKPAACGAACGASDK